MPLLPAVVPDIPEDRSQVVKARLARKVAPLFGVPWPGAPFELTWVCDYTTLTLAEIARGSPLPERSRQSDARAVQSGPRRADGKPEPLPNELANATLHRFGPDAKAAVLLTAANQLLAPLTEGIDAAVSVLHGAALGVLPVRLRLAAWAAMVLEAFRSQPALLVAAIQARQIQRAASTRWELPLPHRLRDQPLARCEVGAVRGARWQPGSATSPVDLDVADRTIRAIRLPADSPPDTHMVLAEGWLRRLAAMGTPYGDGYLWLGERGPGHRVVEAFIPQTPTLDAYLGEVAPLLCPDDPTETMLPLIPDPAEVAELSTPARRGLVLGLTTIIRQVRFDPQQRESTRDTVTGVLERLVRLTEHSLGADDPVTLVTRCQAADIRVQTLRHNLGHDLSGPMRDLLDALDWCKQAERDGTLDRGMLAALVYSGNVEINVVRRNNATLPDTGLPTPDELNAHLSRSWSAFLELVDIDPDSLAAEEPEVARQAGFPLSAYASYLAGQDGEADLRSAAHLFQHIVLPARQHRYERTRAFQPLRQSLQTASRATTELALRAEARGDLSEARQWAALGHSWITTAAAHDHTRRLLTTGGEAACHFALLAAPALLAAARVGVSASTSDDVAEVQRLLDVAREFAVQVTAGTEHRYARQADIDRIDRMLADHFATVSVTAEHEQQRRRPLRRRR
ncbi:MAG: hypothetical protein ACT4NY_18045 [Pseudonocardiales bacterium]